MNPLLSVRCSQPFQNSLSHRNNTAYRIQIHLLAACQPLPVCSSSLGILNTQYTITDNDGYDTRIRNA